MFFVLTTTIALCIIGSRRSSTSQASGLKAASSTPSINQNIGDKPNDTAFSSIPSKRSSLDIISEVEDVVNDPSHKPLHKRVTILEVEFLSESGSDYVDSKPSSARSSLNSIDFVLIDHLVGPGTTSSRLTTNDRILIGQVDVSQVLMDGRRNLIRKQSEIKDPSDLLYVFCYSMVLDFFYFNNLIPSFLYCIQTIERSTLSLTRPF